MFGQMFDPHSQQRRTRRAHHHQQRQQESPQDKQKAMLLQFLPLILMVLMYGMFSSAPEASFSMNATDRHKYVQKSYNLNVPFFVSNKFANMNPREKMNVQYQVERDYLQNLQSLCETE